MKRLAIIIGSVILVGVYSCGSKKNIPDVSGIQVKLDTFRFDRDFFGMDTMHMEQSLDLLQQKYPAFVNDYLYNLLAVPPNKDSTLLKVKQFIHDYTQVYDTIITQYPSIAPQAKDITTALRFVKYYFPNYKAPAALITFAGPLEGYSNVLTTSGFAVGLQLYLGKNYPAYNTDYIADIYPQYQSKRFDAAHLPVDCIKNVISELYPASNTNQPLVYQMVEVGKRLYVLDAFMPETADTLKTGYTKKQLDVCFANEGYIWSFFVQHDLLYITDPMQVRDYMNDGPKTEAINDEAPGFIGQFVGWQIVKKWMEQDSKRTPAVLLQTTARQIFEEAKYKPH